MKLTNTNRDEHNWLPVVEENVRTLRFGVVQIVVHDSKVVQIEKTERTRFGNPNSGASKQQPFVEVKS